jgi:hypothetical protein
VYPTSQDYFPTKNVRNSVAAVGPTGDGDANSSHDNAGPRNALSSPVLYNSNDTSSRSSRDVALQSNDSSPTDERPRNALSTSTSGEGCSVLNHRISKLMAVLNPNNISEEQKGLVSSSLRYLLQYKNGLPFIKELFFSYEAAECDKMLFELQMIRSIRFPKKEMYYPLRSIETSTNDKKRYFSQNFDEQDGDEVTYVDKPNQILT